jgi:hypothetical protein
MTLSPVVVAASAASLLCLVSSVAHAAQQAPAAPAAPKAEPKTGPEATPRAPAEVGHGAVRTPKLVKRVGGNRENAIRVVDGVYRFEQAMIESPLPDGYPEPTPFGAIDIKEYPSVRRAELTSKDDSGNGMVAGFFPLFNHIKKRDIAMTAPVEMDYPGLYKDFMKDEPSEEGSSFMKSL